MNKNNKGNKNGNKSIHLLFLPVEGLAFPFSPSFEEEAVCQQLPKSQGTKAWLRMHLLRTQVSSPSASEAPPFINHCCSLALPTVHLIHVADVQIGSLISFLNPIHPLPHKCASLNARTLKSKSYFSIVS